MIRSGPLKRTPMKPGTTPMARTPMPRRTTGLQSSSSLKRAACDGDGLAVARPPRIKTSRPNLTPIRKSAQGEDCTLRFSVCRNDTRTTVWCHSNRLADGKGMGLKAHDEAGCYGCAACHAYLDGGWAASANMSYSEVQEHFEVARAKSRVILQQKGLISQ